MKKMNKFIKKLGCAKAPFFLLLCVLPIGFSIYVFCRLSNICVSFPLFKGLRVAAKAPDIFKQKLEVAIRDGKF